MKRRAALTLPGVAARVPGMATAMPRVDAAVPSDARIAPYLSALRATRHASAEVMANLLRRRTNTVARWGGLVWFALAAGCAHQADARAPHQVARIAPSPPPAVGAAAQPVPEAAPPVVTLAAPPGPTPRSFVTWIREHLPEGGEVDVAKGEAPEVFHTAQPGQTIEKIAGLYLDLVDVYLLNDYAEAIRKANPKSRYNLKPGTRLAIPHLITEPYLEGDAARIGWPEDKVMKGVYMRGDTAGGRLYVGILDRMAERGMNAIVLDTKDTDGWLTYKSKVPLAIETKATQPAAIRDLARAIRFAHERGIRVIMRISCFHDELVSKAKLDMSIRGNWGGALKIGWFDPSNPAAHQYVIDLAKEGMDAGADEIQLDYVRFPVFGTKNADFHLKERNLTRVEVIRSFVHEVHAVTQARHVPLSLDVFGVIALGKRVDIDALGQELPVLAAECEALSPMIYPSHYSKGFMGFDEPGAHPELIGVGTKGAIDQVAGIPNAAVIRPWLQDMNWESPGFGPEYLRTEIKHAESAGGVGWLLWNPGQDYSYAFQIMPKRPAPPPPPPAGPTSLRSRKHRRSSGSLSSSRGSPARGPA